MKFVLNRPCIDAEVASRSLRVLCRVVPSGMDLLFVLFPRDGRFDIRGGPASFRAGIRLEGNESDPEEEVCGPICCSTEGGSDSSDF